MEVEKSLNNKEVTIPDNSRDVKKQKTLIGANVILMILIAVAIFIFISYINDRHYYRCDMTASGRYSLSSKTKKILKNLDEPIFITSLLVKRQMQL